MKSGVLYLILASSACVGFVAWRVHAVKTQETPHFEIVEDPSLSHKQGCESLLGLVEQVLSADGASPGSTLTILVLGDKATANEPWELGRYSVARTRKVLEGRRANLRRRRDVLRDVLGKCQAVPPTNVSPIFLGVKQALADLRAKGCSETTHCKLFVDSDLEDNVERSIREGLTRRGGKADILQSPLDNEGIDVTSCGLAVTAGHIVDPSGREILTAPPRNSHREDRLQQVWAAVFSRPEAVKFEPYCPHARD